MAKKKKAPPPPICRMCGKSMDQNAILDALEKGHRYTHECGRVVVKGDMP